MRQTASTGKDMNVASTLIGAITKLRPFTVCALGFCASSLTSYLLVRDQLQAFELCAEPPRYPWSHNGIFSSLDHGSIRRGYQVYKQVCSACHSMKGVAYRHLVDVCLTTQEAKAEAADVMVEDGPDEEGAMFMRPGKLTDRLPRPYKNDAEAKFANNGAVPPDLSFMALARERGIDYVFSLLTNYQDPPEGVKKEETLHYNPYFPGGKLAMQAPLYDDIIEYEDGTPATLSQLAKDLCTFLTWTSQMEHDERKFYALKTAFLLPPLLLFLAHMKRVKWSSVKTRKVYFFTPKRKYQD